MRVTRIIMAGLIMLAGPWDGMTPLVAAGEPRTIPIFDPATGKVVLMDSVRKTDEEWKQQLTPEQYAVTRQKGTERPFSGQYAHHHEQGIYRCVCCHTALYRSETKFESGTGWPSFWAPIDDHNVRYVTDDRFGIRRMEVVCARCNAHLGHVFDDGPAPTHKRHCLNSVALHFTQGASSQ